MEAKKQYVLPEGKTTTNRHKWVNAWKDLYSPIEQNLNLEITGFGPDLEFKYDGQMIVLPLWFAKILNEKFEQMNETIQRLETQNAKIDNAIRQLQDTCYNS